MEIDTLTTFINVARHGSFAAVARTSNIDPSLISRAVAGLENELGFRLFQRTTRKMALTEAGALYLARVEAVVDELGDAHDAALALSSTPQGTLRLSASVAFGQTLIVPQLRKFRKTYPDIALELILSDDNLDLVEQQIDLAIRLAPSIDNDVICSKLIDTHYRVCASPDYLSTASPLSAPEDLSAHDALLFSLKDFRTRWIFRDRAGETTDISINGHITMTTALAIRDAMLAGLGPALLPNWLVDDDIAQGRCVQLFPDYDVTATTFETAAWFIYPSRQFLPNKVRVTVDFLRQHINV
jgi:DNA-binding transcriptional LysR family regulator